MNTKVFWLSLIAVVMSFAGGFLLANAFNRSELNSLKAENERLKIIQNETVQSDSDSDLGTEEIRRKIAEADQNPTNLAFQKSLGTALYRYAVAKQDVDLLGEVIRLLERVHMADENDYETLVLLGNIHFDIGYFKKENGQFEQSRKFYQKALAQKPDDAEVRTDFGLTFLLAAPPETEKAIPEFQKSLKGNSKHEKALQAMTQAFISQKKPDEAEKYLSRLREVNQSNPAISQLTSQLDELKNSLQ